MKKIISLFIILCCFLMACGSVEKKKTETVAEQASERPYAENMSQEDFLQVSNDYLGFCTDMENVWLKMTGLCEKYADTLNTAETFDWSQYWDFRETKEEAIAVCDKILSYDDNMCSKEYQLCIDENKSLAYQIKYYFNAISKERDVDELTVLSQNLDNDISVGMNNATIYQTMATIAYLEANDGDPATIADMRKKIADSYMYKTTGSSTANSGTSNIVFTNSFGTSTTKCAHSGCVNAIASSGDTNCCIVHSNKCLNCGKYIDEDAMFCMDCISGKTTTLEDTGKYNSSNVPAGGCHYKFFNGTICGKPTNHYIGLCDDHFKELNDTYQSMAGE